MSAAPCSPRHPLLHCWVSRLRIAAINFLNPAPLMWDFEHEPARSRLSQRYSIHETSPALCAQQLSEGAADVGLIPVAACAFDPTLVIIPGCAIASLDYIRSIILVVRGEVENARRVALDTASRTSATYTRILFHKYWNAKAEFTPHAPEIEGMLAEADAALLIGDPALLALEDRGAREARTGEKLRYIDLGHEWRVRTGVPWVSAFWGVRAEAAARVRVEDFQLSRDHGLAHVDDLAAEWSAKIPVPAATIHTYLTANIYYHLDEQCRAGLDLFYRYAVECAALPRVPALKLL